MGMCWGITFWRMCVCRGGGDKRMTLCVVAFTVSENLEAVSLSDSGIRAEKGSQFFPNIYIKYPASTPSGNSAQHDMPACWNMLPSAAICVQVHVQTFMQHFCSHLDDIFLYVGCLYVQVFLFLFFLGVIQVNNCFTQLILLQVPVSVASKG